MTPEEPIRERVKLAGGYPRAQSIALFAGGIGMVLAMLVGYFSDPSFKRFYFAYLVSFAFFLSISLGGLFFVLLQHVTRAGWSVDVRRIGELVASIFPLLAALSAPIVLSVILHHGDLYRWSQSIEHVEAAGNEHLAEVIHVKHAWLNPVRFVAFIVLYFAIWSLIGGWYWRQSVKQDQIKDDSITLKMQRFAPVSVMIFGITITFAAFDLLMSLDPAWFSTMFGVYFFAGCAVAFFATLIVVLHTLQRSGYLIQSVTIEHYHDLGKFLFAFTFFWGYIAFSQYMLLWYANMPATSEWFARRGAATGVGASNGWTPIILTLLFGHLLIPFAGMLSRHIKRNKKILVFWAGWMLVFHWLDLLWLIMPELDGKFHLGFVELFCLVGIGGIYIAGLLRIALRHSLRPLGDPRVKESLAFENV